ncbi:tetratricopeptide repeat protein [Acetobacter vaccinii]|uniref:Tetratricopeptide repeat protein n=2 Tax=Acetobacter vaccinii TaxID=2592655 RepID=A0A5C1YTI7_9PROT|nr:tetratricopeptide repeat protein [Acetobacter vaccinii]
MLFCRLLPTVFLLSTTVLGVLPAVAWGADAASGTGASTHAIASAGGTATTETGSVDSGAFLRGIIAARMGDDPEAAQAFAAALRSDPSSTVLLKQAFVHSVMAGDPQAEALALRLGKTSDGENLVSDFVLGNAAVGRDKWADALHHYQQAAADPLARLILPLLQAWCEEGQGEAARAVAGLLKSQTSVLSPFYVLHAGLVAHVGGLNDQTGELFARAQKLMPGYDLLLTRAYAAWLWNHGRQDNARELLRNLIEADPVLAVAGPELQATIARPPVTSAREGMARAYVLTAYLLRQQGHEQGGQTHAGKGDSAMQPQFDEAARLMLGFALEMDPKLADARLMLAEIQEDQGHEAVARETLLHIAHDDPLAPVATLRLAILDSATDKADEAVALLRGLDRQSPDQLLVLRELGNALFQQKDWKGAIAVYSRAIDLVAKQKGEDWPLLLMRAMAYHEIGDWPHARDDARAALAYAPDEPLLLNFLGYSMVERHENLAEAENLLRKAHNLAPQEAAITDSLGWAKVERGDMQGGLPLLEKAVESTPEDPEVNYHLGEAYWRLGRHIEAVDQWNVALGLHPSEEDAKLIRAALHRAGAPVPDGVASETVRKGEHEQ